ncbi:hypothetical protein ETD86_29600 [Nonomuraea turkmeniaca]|uniref:Uncharacterized protein n=1 Tax=Nonomuraea turkmeniaca TaxID=103838 RepID=A0A5S4FA08_9ACTN|nr:hypothetical protein [Nonomuraea turkmeniaca]TMR14103.1 hypothetical protein ETD86_29600 [Nonomuraea turkmeniaca]
MTEPDLNPAAHGAVLVDSATGKQIRPWETINDTAGRPCVIQRIVSRPDGDFVLISFPGHAGTHLVSPEELGVRVAMTTIEGLHHFDIPIDGQHHTINLSGKPIDVTVNEDRTIMHVVAATDALDPERDRTFKVYSFHPSMLGRMEELPAGEVPRGDTGFRPDRWVFGLYELVRGR